MAEKLKTEKRKTRLSNDEWENVASHCWMVSLLALLFNNQLKNRVDQEKVLKMIIIHDLAEAKTGDIAMGETFSDHNKEIAKRKKEKANLQKMLKLLPKTLHNEIYALWNEFEENQSAEARLAKALDKLESYFQVSMAEDISYLEKLGSGDLYWKIYCQDLQKDLFRHEPVLCSFWEDIKSRILEKMIAAGRNPEDYK